MKHVILDNSNPTNEFQGGGKQQKLSVMFED